MFYAIYYNTNASSILVVHNLSDHNFDSGFAGYGVKLKIELYTTSH